jgi:DNA primase
MEIAEIKAALSLSTVLKHYNIVVGINHRLNCPFHEDKTPSMQVYYNTHTAFCFSANCKLHGKAIDVIDFIMYKEFSALSETEAKHAAIEKAKALITGEIPKQTPIYSRSQFLEHIFKGFKNGLVQSHPARNYLLQRGLDPSIIEAGYNTGQFYHSQKRDEHLIENCLKYGLLSQREQMSRTGVASYSAFGKNCVCFALKDKNNKVVSLYFRSVIPSVPEAPEGTAKHFYLKNREGLYPCYPSESTTKLILTESIIDAATLLQNPSITSEYSILACYGTNGLNEEISEAISQLKQLKEIVFFFDGDAAGEQAVSKYSKVLQNKLPRIKISKVQTPEGEDINSLIHGHESIVLNHLLNNRILLHQEQSSDIILSPPLADENKTSESIESTIQLDPKLNSINPNKIIYTTTNALYYVMGGVPKQMDNLKIMLQIENIQGFKTRNKIDLYEDKQVEKLCKEITEKLQINYSLLEQDLYNLTNALEKYREQELLKINNINPLEKPLIKIPEPIQKKCMDFLSKPGLIPSLNKLIGKAGVVGEDNNRLFLFVIASSYKMKNTLHALIQGSSGSGKTRLLKIISDLMPPEDTRKYTRVTESSFYNQEEYYFVNKLICFEDYDGLKEEAQYAVRELQSNEILVSFTSVKNESGKISSDEKTVRGPIASMACTTRGEIYEDNISRCFVIAVDESKEQTLRVIDYQNKISAGLIDKEEQKRVVSFAQNCIRLLKPYEVINPFATQIKLPEKAHKIRRLNELYHSLVKQVTLLHQYQRKKDDEGRIISEPEDLITACDIMFESILLKVDELDGALRHFFERLKSYVESHSRDYEFDRFEIREATRVSKTQQHVYMSRLVELEYLRQNGFANRGYKYKIQHWDNLSAMRKEIKDFLQVQLNTLSN